MAVFRKWLLSYLAANIWTQVPLEIKQCKSFGLGSLKFVLVNYVRHIFTMLVSYEAKCISHPVFLLILFDIIYLYIFINII